MTKSGPTWRHPLASEMGGQTLFFPFLSTAAMHVTTVTNRTLRITLEQ